MLRRVKRNFLGDLLHTLTGVATDDQLQAQLRLDEEIREKVLSVLTHQNQYEEEMGKVISGLSKEEEGLTADVAAMRDTHQRDYRCQVRLSALMTVVDADLQMLEDILSSVMNYVAPSRLSAYLAFKSGLPFASTFTYVDSTHLSSTVTVAYESLLYHEVPLMSSRPSINSSSLILQTSTTQYLIHPGHPDPQLLSAHEV